LITGRISEQILIGIAVTRIQVTAMRAGLRVRRPGADRECHCGHQRRTAGRARPTQPNHHGYATEQ
jgi:hypothetical protein